MPKVKYEEKSLFKRLLSQKWVVLASNLVFQGMRYMTWGERAYKLSITLLFGFIINLLIHNIMISLVIGHLLNYILNGQFYVVFRYLSSKQVMSKEDLEEFIGLMKKEIETFHPLDVLVIGSFCRGKMSKTSDLDIRIYHKPDFLSSLKAYIMATRLRFYGLLYKFPIDVYCFSDLTFLDKISKSEIPVNFLKNEAFLQKYPTSENLEEHMKKLVLE